MSNIINLFVFSSPIGRCSPGFLNTYVDYVQRTFPDRNISVNNMEMLKDLDYADHEAYDWERYLVRFADRVDIEGDYLIVDADNFPNTAALFDRQITPEAKSRFYAVCLLKEKK